MYGELGIGVRRGGRQAQVMAATQRSWTRSESPA